MLSTQCDAFSCFMFMSYIKIRLLPWYIGTKVLWYYDGSSGLQFHLHLSLSPSPSQTRTKTPPRALCPVPDLSKYVANLKHVAANWKHWAFKTMDFSFAHANSSQEIPSDEMTQNMSTLGRHLGPRGGGKEGRRERRGVRRVYTKRLKGRGMS